MKTKATLTVVLAGALVLILNPAVWAGGPIEARQADQRAVIYQGLKSGHITEAEFAELDSEQYQIETYRRRAFADGYLDRDEGRYLRSRMDRAERSIRLARSNAFLAEQVGWRWDDRYNRYRHRDYWRHNYHCGPYRPPRRHYRPPPPRYQPPPRRPWPEPCPPHHRPDHRPPPEIRPYGHIQFGFSQPGFGFGWSIGLR